MILLAAAILNCYFIICCKGVSVTLGTTNSTYVQNGTSLHIECRLPSGNIDLSTARGWLKDGVSLISGGISSGAGSGYTETVTAGDDAFSLDTPPMDFTFDGSVFRCEYGFLQATLNIMISAEFGSTDQSKEDCIDGKSIEKCWFSLSKVFPEVDSKILTVTYKDDTVENITSMLNMTSQLNTDGTTRAYYFRIEPSNSVMSISKDVKAVKLSFIAGPVSRTLTIMIKDCSQDIFLYGFLPVFLIVLIASIAINILKIDFLSKQFGEFTWKKVGITAVFFVIAIIIGVCLGLLIKGCDKKFLALGLSFLFGILLVVALIIVLIYYHKKCESKSDIQDGDGGEDSNRFSLDSCFRKCKVKPEKEINSQNNTGSNTTRTGTGRVGSPASTSNVELAANLKSES